MCINSSRIFLTGLGVWIALSIAGLHVAAMETGQPAPSAPHEKPAVSEKTQGTMDPGPPWNSINGKVVKYLRFRTSDKVADRLAGKKPPADAAALMRRLNIFVRANRTREAAETLDRLAASGILVTGPGPGEGSSRSISLHNEAPLRGLAGFLIRQEQWDLARRFFALFPEAERVAPLAFVEQWLRRGGDPDEIERWLIARAKTDPHLWIWVWLRFRRRLGTVEALIEEMAADVRAHPSDATRAKQYARHVHTAGFWNNAFEARVRWMGEVCKPRLAFKSYELGRALAAEAPGAAAPLFQRSLATDCADRDRELIRASPYFLPACSFLSDQDCENLLRQRTMRELAECYQKIGRSDQAQPLVERLVRSEASGLPSTEMARFAGSVEEGSGARAIERLILDVEDANATSGTYWLVRADYFAGRSETTAALHAYAKALELTPYKRRETPSTAGRRHIVRRRYVRFLSSASGPRDAMKMLWRDFYRAPPGSDNTHYVVREMVRAQSSTSTALLTMSDPRLWVYLAAQRRHGYTERRLLRHMVENWRDFWRVTVREPAEEVWWDADHVRARTVSFLRDFAASIWRGPREFGQWLYAGVCTPFVGKKILPELLSKTDSDKAPNGRH